MDVLDSHLHLWDPAVLDYAWLTGPLAHAFAERELEHARLTATREEGAIFVQADCRPDQFLDEVGWASALAPRTRVRGIVAGAHLDRGRRTVRHLDRLAGYPIVCGVRHQLQSEVDGFARSGPFRHGAEELIARGWTFDACVRGAEQLSDVTFLADALPELRIVLDHLGKPVVGTAGAPLMPSDEWRRGVHDLAEHPRVHVKLSGLPAEAGGDWTYAQVTPFLDVAAEAFGQERLMFGSDWPVSAIGPDEAGAPSDGSDAYRYTARDRWATSVARWARERGLDEGAIMARNAARFYGIG